MLLSHLFEDDDVLKGLDLPSYEGPGRIKRNTYKPLGPGNKRQLQIRINDLKEKFEEVKLYHRNLIQFMSNVPPGLEQDLKELEQEYLEAIRLETEALKASVNDSKVVKLIEGIRTKCSDSVKAMRAAKTFLYRGTSNNGDVYIGKPHTNRRVMTSSSKVQELYDDMISKAGFKALRGNSIFTSGDIGLASGFGRAQYLIFPVNGFDFTWSRSKRDIVIDSDSVREWYNKDLVYDLWNQIFTNPTNKDRFLELAHDGQYSMYKGNQPVPYDYQHDYVMSYDGFLGQTKTADNLRVMTQMQEEGLLKNVPTDMYQIVTPERVVENMDLSHEDFVAALKSENEICIHGTYYAISRNHIDLVGQQLSIGEYDDGSYDEDPLKGLEGLYSNNDDEEENYDSDDEEYNPDEEY